MRQAGVNELGIRVKSPFHEPAEVGSRRRSVKAVVVIEDVYPHACKQIGKPYSLPEDARKSNRKKPKGAYQL